MERPACKPAGAAGFNASSLSAAIAAICLGGCASLAEPDRTATVDAIDGAGVTVYAAGDIADCRKMPAARTGAAQTAAMIAIGLAADPAALVLALGDTSYPAGVAAEFTDCYAPTWGRFRERTMPAPGNHEYYTPGASGYYDYFGELAGPGRRGYFSKEVGAWHVISLNSNLKPPATASQLAWLREDLAQLRARRPQGCILAFWHHPVYSSGGHGNNAHMLPAWQALLDARADVVLAAHDHDYERFAPQDARANRDERNGIRSFVVGTGGAELTLLGPTKPHSMAQDNASFGVLKMVLKPAGYEWGYQAVGRSGALDAGSARCHGS